ncbi:response regulator [Desulfosporosinus sp. SYSU MS00001]|uniref:response regulator n=1 Tax=Desulfosporosinus sp. SYSU MS00001 TaxID=3416284 RepID=UPI003CEEFF74
MHRAEDIKILLVADEPNILEFLEMGFKYEGFTVRIAQNEKKALKIAKSFQPHVALIDLVGLKVGDSNLSSSLKRIGETAIIFLTEKNEDSVNSLLEADDYLGKPFSFEDLLARINCRINEQFPHLLDGSDTQEIV